MPIYSAVHFEKRGSKIIFKNFFKIILKRMGWN